MSKKTFLGFSKKTKIILVTSIFLLTSVASSYAWFQSSQHTSQQIQITGLSIESTFPEQTTSEFKPGLTNIMHGTIENTGHWATLIKLENNATTTFAFMQNGTPILPEERTKTPINPAIIKINYQPTSKNYDDDANIIWLNDKNNTVYLMLEPAAKAKIDFITEFDETATSTEYEQAQIDIQTKITMAQVLEGAIQNEFGISSNDLMIRHTNIDNKEQKWQKFNNLLDEK